VIRTVHGRGYLLETHDDGPPWTRYHAGRTDRIRAARREDRLGADGIHPFEPTEVAS